jgi:HAMP domain-containing protein
MSNDERSKAVKETLKLTAMAAGGLAARTLWITVRTLLLFIAVMALVYRFVVVPRMDNYHKAMQSAAYSELRSNAPGATASPGKYAYHYELTDEQKHKLLDAWSRKQITKIYVVMPQGVVPRTGLSPEQQKIDVEEATAASKELLQMFWDNSIDAAAVDEANPQRFWNHGLSLVLNRPDDGSLAPRPPEVDLLLAVFNAAGVSVSCCPRDAGVPEGAVAIAVGAK